MRDHLLFFSIDNKHYILIPTSSRRASYIYSWAVSYTFNHLDKFVTALFEYSFSPSHSFFFDLSTMPFRTAFLTASLLALASAGPLPQDVAAALKRQLAMPSEYPANSGGPVVQPSGANPTGVMTTATATAPAVTATYSASDNSSMGSVSVKGFVTGSVVVSSINDHDGKGAGSDAYKLYEGDGSTSAGWPASTDWVSFNDMFEANKPVMKSSCSSLFGVPDNSDQEITAIHHSIEAVAKASKVDHRFILAVMMQESTGCVRVKTTNWGNRNPGLMQDHDGTATCNDDKTSSDF